MRVEVSDQEWLVAVHEACFAKLLAGHPAPLPADRPAAVPFDAVCSACGGRIPIIGRHPYALSRGTGEQLQTWFVHEACLPESVLL